MRLVASKSDIIDAHMWYEFLDIENLLYSKFPQSDDLVNHRTFGDDGGVSREIGELQS